MKVIGDILTAIEVRSRPVDVMDEGALDKMNQNSPRRSISGWVVNDAPLHEKLILACRQVQM